jgi:hypothetical protein
MKEIQISNSLAEKLADFVNTANEVEHLLEEAGIEDADLDSMQVDIENSKIILYEKITNDIQLKFEGKKDLPLIGVCIVFILTILQGLNIIQVGDYNPDLIYAINWKSVPSAIIELVVIVFLADKKGIFPWISRRIYGIKK